MSGQRRISADRRLWLEARLSQRDLVLLDWLSRLRLTTGRQIESLTFGALDGHSRSVVRGRVLSRLCDWGLIEVVDRRIGGARRGSTSSVYRLSHAGHLLLRPDSAHPAKPYTDRFTDHTLAAAQLAADLTVAVERTPHDLVLRRFVTEPASWSPDGLGNYLKPDIYLQLEANQLTMHWWVEVDRGTESLPTLERKLSTYLDFVARGQVGPHDLIPRVLVSVPDGRAADVQRLHARLPPPADQLFVICPSSRAVVTLLAALRE